MRILLWLLALFALAVGVSLAFGYNEGYVLLVLPPWRIELSLNLFVVLVVGGFLLGHVLLRVVSHTLRLPQAVRAFRERKRREKGTRALRACLATVLPRAPLSGPTLKPGSGASAARTSPACSMATSSASLM